MHFTLWPSRTANEGGHAWIDWQTFLAFVAAPTIAEDKNTLEGWSPAKFAGNRRGVKYVEAVSAIVLDLDSSPVGLTIDGVWFGYGGVVHTSHSHLVVAPNNPDGLPKYRVVLPASRDMMPDEHAIVWRIVRDLAEAHGHAVDEATKDPSRLWYVPAHKSGGPYAHRLLQGPALDVDAILATAAEVTDVSSPAPDSLARPLADGSIRQSAATPSDRRNAMATALGASWPAKGRHEAQLALAGALRVEGFTEAEAVDFLCQVCGFAGNEDRAKRAATCRHTWSRPEGSAMTGWTRLKAFIDPVVVDVVRNGLGRDAEWTEKTTRRLAEVSAQAVPAEATPLVDTVTLGGVTFETGGYDAELPPINYQIDGLIARGEVIMFVAHGNSLKTWLAFSIAHAIASGRPWLGRFVASRGRSAIVDFESGRYEVLRRLKLLGVKSAEVEDRLLRTSYPVAQFVDPETWIGLAGHGLEFMAIDSFNAAAPDLDENDARAALMLQHAGRFAEATACTVVVIHHSRKGSGGDRRESVRGSTALFAACDRIFEFADLEKGAGGTVRTTMRSVKDGAGRAPLDVRVELSDQGLRFVEEAEVTKEEAERADSPEKNRQYVIETLRKHSAGVAKARIVETMKGRRADKFDLLSQLDLQGIIVEYRDSATKKEFIMLKPGVEL